MLLKYLIFATIGFIQIYWCNGIKEQLKAIDGTSKRRLQLPHQNQQQIQYDTINKHYNQHQQSHTQQHSYKDFEFNKDTKRKSYQQTLKYQNKFNLNNNSKGKFKRDISNNPFLQKQISQNAFISNPFLSNAYTIKPLTQKPNISDSPAPSPNKVNIFLQNTNDSNFSTLLMSNQSNQKTNISLIFQNSDNAAEKLNSQINETTNVFIGQNFTVSKDLGINNTSTSNSVVSENNSASRVHFTTPAPKSSPTLSELIKNEAVIFPDSPYILKTTQNPQEVLDIRR